MMKRVAWFTLVNLLLLAVMSLSLNWSNRLKPLATKAPNRVNSSSQELLGGFWGYLKRMLAARGGIRRERLPLYLAEYIWRYNHRGLKIRDKIKSVLFLIENRYKFSG